MIKATSLFFLFGLACVAFFYVLIVIVKEGVTLSDISHLLILSAVYLALAMLFFFLADLDLKNDFGIFLIILLPICLCVFIISFVCISYWSLQRYANELAFQSYKHEPIYLADTKIIIGIKVFLSFKTNGKTGASLDKPVFFYHNTEVHPASVSDFYRKDSLRAIDYMPQQNSAENYYVYDLYAYPIELSRTSKAICLREAINLAPIKKPKQINYFLHGSVESINLGNKLLTFINGNNIDYSEFSRREKISINKLIENIPICN
jgi:hypothetical protein